MGRAGLLLAGGASAVLAALAGCSSGSAATHFTPSPTGPVEGSNGVHVQPIEPGVGVGGGGGSTGGSGSGTPVSDPQVVATRLRAPVGIVVLPDNTALVGERATGRIVRVQPKAGQPVRTVRTITGLDPAGGGGLLDLALSPDYAEDSLIYAYVTTRSDNRVVAFTLHGPVTPVLTGIPRGRSGNAGRLAFGADGDLYVGTGVAGRPVAAQRTSSLAGKVLRVSQIGRPVAGNLARSSPVWATGLAGVTGLCTVPQSPTVLSVEPGTAGGELDSLDGGADYGYPRRQSASRGAVGSLPRAAGQPGGCAVLAGRVWITSLDGHELLSAPVPGATGRVGPFVAALHNRYGRLRSVVAGADGVLWLTTSNRDGHGRPVPADERVIRYKPTPQNSGVGSTA